MLVCWKSIAIADKFIPHKLQPLWQHPAGPKTIFFWAPAFKWGLVLAGIADLSRPAEAISFPQTTALAATGVIWSRYSLVIIPKNYSLFSVNVFVALTQLYQMYRGVRLAIKYGSFFLGGASLLSGIYLNNHFRRKFLLLHYGRAASYLPICALPAALSVLFHSEMVLRDVLLMKTDTCPLCIELRASSFQSTFGLIFPLIAAPMGCAVISQRYLTYNLPYITQQPLEVLNILKKMVRPIKSKLWAIFLGQAVLGSIVTHFEAKSIIKINKELYNEELLSN